MRHIAQVVGIGWTIAALISPAGLASAAGPPQDAKMSIVRQNFGKTPDGQAVDQFICTNGAGAVLKLINYGATVQSLELPDRQGRRASLVLGFDTLDGYVNHTAYFGCTVGRYANRIAAGRFKLDGQEIQLSVNREPNHLHGGHRGFNRVVWRAEPIHQDDAVGVRFTYRSPDGEEGYPGNLAATAVYLLRRDNTLAIEFAASTDKPTIVNMANHAYWNLAGAGSGDVLGHELTLAADHYLPVDDTLIPTGELALVKNTPMDFTAPARLGPRVEQLKSQAAGPPGFDHCFVLRNQDQSRLARAAVLKDPASGRVMEVWTTQPGVQFYTGNFLNGDPINGGYRQYAGLCLETQHYPDSPNKPQFPSVVLRPGETYRQITEHRFRVE
jgi:aldose 1-epimerase